MKPTAARGTTATDAKKRRAEKKAMRNSDAEERARAASRDVGMNMGSRLGRVAAGSRAWRACE